MKLKMNVKVDKEKDKEDEDEEEEDLLECELNANVSQGFLQYLMLYHQCRGRARACLNRNRNRI